MLIGSSLKMYFGRARTLEWTRAVAAICAEHPAVRQGLVEPFVIPTFPSIPDVVAVATDAGMLVGAQDLHWEDTGAFTGEVSAAELAEHGVTLAEIGHAERRRLFGETDETVALKVAAALRNGIAPVLCIGEEIEVEPAAAAAACIAQLDASLAVAREQERIGRLIVAYEPVWAIGAPQPAGDDHIRAVGTALRARLAELPFDAQVIYGGSAGPGLLPRIADSVDGMFLGRFAHEPAAFGAILDEALALEGQR
ncbi:triose-phosphate isomerase family protein [Agrococcus sp. ARC_14]|uniref:triose-phosphate isomerase family protein n=1 Tax=Agrococcus sp. ARC_14 TaxID=2919927 RepID=UPI001F067CE4|nr:triose-phosphate isomerase family protein [Agrococcus sp. ARC_14]MCH1883807.1 triose-phosphate isomerase [Agrococcus sp. ARC_14]